MSDFYVGYHARASPETGGFVRRIVAVLLLWVVVLAAVLTSSQRRFADGTFEYQVYRQFVGTIRSHPYPALVVDSGLASGTLRSTFLLARFGKFGAAKEVEGLDGQRVRLRGALIYREDMVSLEIEPGSIERLTELSSSRSPVSTDLGEHTLVGEIVDSKCWSGVMKPGRGKVHRSCAVRCLSGGVPPFFVVETAAGDQLALLMEGTDGGAVDDQILDRVSETLRVMGHVHEVDGMLRLVADAAAYQSLR